MAFKVPRSIQILSVAFFLIFIGFNGAQQYTTTFFDSLGQRSVGFTSLLLIYLSFSLSSAISATLVEQFGVKRTLITASLFYILFMVSLPLGNIPLLYLASILIGLAAGPLWTAQNALLVWETPGNEGESSGFFGTFLGLANVAGVLVAAWLLSYLSYKLMFLLLVIFPFLGILVLLILPDTQSQTKATEKQSSIAGISTVLMHPLLLLVALLPFASQMAFGLAFGVIPIEIARTMGTTAVGVVSALYFGIPIVLQYPLGRLSDTLGRRSFVSWGFFFLIFAIGLLTFLDGPVVLVSSLILSAVGFSVLSPVSMALVADIAMERLTLRVSGLFWIARSVGVVIVLLLPLWLEISTVYAIVLMITVLAFIGTSHVLRTPLADIKAKIDKDISV